MRALPICLLAFLLCLFFAGCAQQAGFPIEWSSNRTGESSGRFERKPKKSTAQLQLEVMDFSDRFTAATGVAIQEILASESDPQRRVALLTWKIRFSAASMEISTGPDPRTALLDMALFISAGQWALKNHWIPHSLGPSAAALIPVYEDLDRRIWQLVENKLTPEQTTLLRDLIQQWTAENPPGYEIALLRFRNLQGVQAADFQAPRDARGLLASVRAWLGEVNNSLLLGDRVLFHLERTPRLLAHQSELTLAQVAQNFPLTQINPDLPALADYVEGLPSRMFEEFTNSLPRSTETNPLQTDPLPDPLLDPLGHPGAFPSPLTLPAVQQTLQETRLLLGETNTLVAGTTELVGAASSLHAQLQTTAADLKTWSDQVDWNQINPADLERQLTLLSSSLASLENSVAGLQTLLIPDPAGPAPAELLLAQSEASLSNLIDRIFFRALLLLGLFFLGATFLILLARSRRRPPSPSPEIK